MKVLDGEAMSLAADHPDPAVGQVLLMAALGTADHDFFGGVVRQLGDASSQDGKVDERVLSQPEIAPALVRRARKDGARSPRVTRQRCWQADAAVPRGAPEPEAPPCIRQQERLEAWALHAGAAGFGTAIGPARSGDRVGARTRAGKPCMSPAVRGKKRCRSGP